MHTSSVKGGSMLFRHNGMMNFSERQVITSLESIDRVVVNWSINYNLSQIKEKKGEIFRDWLNGLHFALSNVKIVCK